MSHTIVLTRVQETVLEFSDDEWDDMQAEGDVPAILWEIAADGNWNIMDRTIEEV